MLGRFISSLQRYQAYNRLLNIKAWFEEKPVLQVLFSETTTPDDVEVFIYNDENSRPSLEVQIEDHQMLVLRYTVTGELRIHWSVSYLDLSEVKEADNREFILDSSLAAIDEINFSLDYGHAYISSDCGLYAIRFTLGISPRCLDSKTSFLQTFGTLRQYFLVNVAQRYQQFINSTMESQQRQQQEFDVE